MIKKKIMGTFLLQLYALMDDGTKFLETLKSVVPSFYQSIGKIF
jgi:hypothetical protein